MLAYTSERLLIQTVAKAINISNLAIESYRKNIHKTSHTAAIIDCHGWLIVGQLEALKGYMQIVIHA